MANDNSGVKIPGEGEGSSLNPEVQRQKTEEKARTKGWRPENEWAGEPEDWVDAREFLGREKLYNKIHDLKQDIYRQGQTFEKELASISGHFLKVQDTEYNRALKTLEEQRDAAIDDGDAKAARQIERDIKEVEKEKEKLKEAAPTQTQRRGGETPEFQKWKEDNSWFEKNQELREDAIAIGLGYAARNPNKNQLEVLEYVEKKIKKMNPEQFSPKNKEQESVDDEENKVERGGGASRGASATSSGRKQKFTENDLNDQERAVMKTFVARGVLKEVAKKNNRTEKEEYIAQLAQAKGLA